jgi:hypothetical protein
MYGLDACCAVDGSPADRATLAEPVHGSLLFAGEAMHPSHPSTLLGAYLSGKQQAERIVKAAEGREHGGDQCSAACYLNEDNTAPAPSESEEDVGDASHL